MLVCKEMLLAVFVVAVTLGAESELKIGEILFCTPTDCTLVACYGLWPYLCILSIFLSALYLFGCKVRYLPCLQIEQSKVYELERNNKQERINSQVNTIVYSFPGEHYSIYYTEPFNLDGYEEIDIKSVLRITYRKGQEDHLLDIVS